MIDWNQVDTVLLDMDGTLLDLRYDNTLWNHLLPARYGERNSLPLDEASEHLFTHMRELRGQLNFYCLDYWAQITGLDIIGLHHELHRLISFRPNAEEFLLRLRRSQKHLVLVTNAHRDSLSVKDAHAKLTNRMHAGVSCHDYGAPKESAEFWAQLILEHPFEPARTLLIDDNAAVLAAASEFGIRHLLTVAQPDSSRPPRDGLTFPALNDFCEIFPDA